MKNKLIHLLHQTLQRLQQDDVLPVNLDQSINVSACKDPSHGDYASNCAMVWCRAAKKTPQALAATIIAALPQNSIIKKAEIAGPGFINFFLTGNCLYGVISEAITAGNRFGCSNIGKKRRIHIEYVSANPTGPLHVGHGRGAAFGASVANLLTASGYQVHREYYVNDAGRQMQTLALSVWLRYLQCNHEEVALPQNAYQGSYVTDIAKKLLAQYQGRFHHTQSALQLQKIDASDDDPEKQLDALVLTAKNVLGDNDFTLIFRFALQEVLGDIRDDLHEFGVDYDHWFQESSLFDKGLVAASLQLLEQHGYVFETDGAKWFRATAFGDEKDRVLVRSNGVTTYFASDVAYHLYKYREGYDSIIDIFGADHHGYIPRIQGFLKALGENPQRVKTLMVQFAILYRGKEKVSMSTRGGQFVTLRELRQEVGNDAARFFYVMRKPEQHLDFDLELAKSHANDNPVYYIQYAHARICSVWRQMAANNQHWDQQHGIKNLSLLTTANEKALITALINYPDIVQESASHHEPHTVAHFLLNLANNFHSYYNAEKFLVEQNALRDARLCLIAAVRHVFANGLQLLGVSAPTHM